MVWCIMNLSREIILYSLTTRENIKFLIEINANWKKKPTILSIPLPLDLNQQNAPGSIQRYRESYRDSNDQSFASESRITSKPIRDSRMNSIEFTCDSRVIREWFASDSWVIREWFASDSRVIREWFASDSRVIREWFASDSRVIREWFVSDSRVIREWFVSDSSTAAD